MAEYKELPAGDYVMAITPFNKDGSIDEVAFREHLSWMAREKIGAYIAGTGFGEGPAMEEKEIWRLYDIAVKEIKGKTPVVAAGHMNPNSVRDVRFAREAKARGMDWYHLYPCVPGHMNWPSRLMLEAHYNETLPQIDMPVTLSQIAAVGFDCPIEVAQGLLDKFPNIIGFHKNGTPGITEAFLRVIAPRAPVVISDSPLAYYPLGARGHLGMQADLAPRLTRAVHDAVIAGDMKKAASLWVKLSVFLEDIRMVNGSPIHPTVKAALNLMGRPAGYVRRPYLDFPEAKKNDLARVLDKHEIKKYEGL